MKLQKETSRHGQWYDDACGTAFALELIGERWSLLIVRELMFGGRRFNDLRAALPGISAKVLTERLEGLEHAGVLQRRMLPQPARVQVYELTPWGYMADEPIMALGRWAAASPGHNPTLPLSAASLMLSFRTMFDAERAADLDFTARIVVGTEDFSALVREGAIHIKRGPCEDAAFTITAPVAMPIAGMVYGKASPEELASAGLALVGDRDLIARFVHLFRLPAKVG